MRREVDVGHFVERLPKKDGDLTHAWRVYVQGKGMAEISKVVFRLHPSFDKPVTEVCKAPFELERRGFGGFDLNIEVLFKGAAQAASFVYDLAFPATDLDVLAREETKLLTVHGAKKRPSAHSGPANKAPATKRARKGLKVPSGSRGKAMASAATAPVVVVTPQQTPRSPSPTELLVAWTPPSAESEERAPPAPQIPLLALRTQLLALPVEGRVEACRIVASDPVTAASIKLVADEPGMQDVTFDLACLGDSALADLAACARRFSPP